MFIAVLDFSDCAVIFTIVILAVSGLSLSVYLKPRENARLFRLEAKVDLLLKHAGLVYDPKGGLPPGVMEALQQGKKIEAIKLYRDVTGIGLAEAKKFIEEVQASLRVG